MNVRAFRMQESVGFSGDVLVNLSYQDDSGLIVDGVVRSVTLVPGRGTNVSVSFGSLGVDDFFHVWVDTGDVVVEDVSNNYLFRPALRPVRVILNVSSPERMIL